MKHVAEGRFRRDRRKQSSAIISCSLNIWVDKVTALAHFYELVAIATNVCMSAGVVLEHCR